MLHYRLVFCFGLQNINRTFVRFSISRNKIERDLFVVRLLVNMLFLQFSGILTCNYISCTYLVAVYILNTPSTPCCLFLTTENVPFTFDAMIWTSKQKPFHFYVFQTSKYVRRYLVCCLFAFVCLFAYFCGFQAFYLVITLAAPILLQFTF